MRTLALTLLLTGCASGVAPFTVDEQFLKRCLTVPALEGTDGKQIMLWAEKAGPIITECTRVHNGLVSIIEAQK